ncbi:MAG: GWxTD domain-containing protein [Candidatus Cloacimonetes bacterium]|nr:GWxTD domain-containing protein [Candidatus Cloacimonadota bacterium]
MIKTLSLILLIALMLIGSLYSQEVIFEHYESGVDFWVLLPYDALNFKKGAETTEYQVSLIISDNKKKQVTNFERSVLIIKRDWLSETAIPLQFNAALETGTYTAVLKLKNKALGEKRSIKKGFQVDHNYTEIGLSWIIAQKDGVSYIPSKVSPETMYPEVLELRQSYSISLDSLRIQIDNNKLMVNNPKNPIHLNLVPYLNKGEENKMKLTFYEKNIHYNLEPFLFSPWYSYSLRYNPSEQIAQLRYIASQNEWQELRKLSEKEAVNAIENYWKATDPSPGTIRNETREKFYQRVLLADDKFSVHKKMKGWASDRGRIYIKYGEPDEINAETYPMGRYPTIIWSYYKQNLEFIFADTQGYGQYTLRNKEIEY